MKDLITPEMKNVILSKQLLPPYEEIATITGVGLSTVCRVMNGASANRKVVKFIKEEVSKQSKELTQLVNAVLKN